MADSVNRIAPAAVPLGRPDHRKRERQEKNHGKAAQDKCPEPPAPADQAVPAASETSEAEKSKGKHINISV
jgi:hypothetical protein